MRERAISAAILVPVLLVVLALGGAVLALAIAIITAIASLELFRLLRAAGHDSFPALGTVLALTVVLDAAFPDVLDGSGLLLSAIGIVLIAVAAFTRQDPRDGLVAWIATVFGAFYVSLTAFVIRLGHVAPAVPDGAPLEFLGGERGWILLLLLAVWSYDTGALLVGKQFGRQEVPDPHLAVEDVRRAHRRHGRVDDRRDRAPVGSRPAADPWPAPRTAGGPLGAGG